MKKVFIPEPKQIKPAVPRISDKFSWRLYEWVRRNPGGRQVYVCTKGLTKGSLYVGDLSDGLLHGGRLMAVLSGGFPRHGYAMLLGANGMKKYKDVTNSFWKEYMRIGVCSIHNSGHIWQPKGKTKRICNTCQKVQVQRVKVEKSLMWVTEKAAA